MVDPKSYELAEYFLADFTPTKMPKALVSDLAAHIQDTVEMWLGHAENRGQIKEKDDTVSLARRL